MARHRMSILRRTAAGLLLLLPACAVHAEWTALEKLQTRHDARITAAALDLDSGRLLQSLHFERRLTPASVSKLVLTAAALDTWRVDKTFTTRVLGTGAIERGHLRGDLMVSGDGDATLDHQGLWYLAAQIRQSGVKVVDGDLVVSNQPFGTLACETKDRCDAQARSHTAYDAPLAAFGVDYGTWCIDVRPAQPGDPAAIQSCAAVDVPIPLAGEIRTLDRRRGTHLWLDRVAGGDDEKLAMGGDIHLGHGRRLYRSMADPALGAGLLLRKILGELGVRIRGQVTVSDAAIPAGGQPLARLDSAPLSEQLMRMLRHSNNYIADVLTLDMAAERTPEPVTTLANAARPLGDLVQRARREAGYPVGHGADAPALYSGSGLTPENRLSAQDLIALLRYEYGRTETFPVFYGGLTVPGQAPYRYMRAGSANWKQRVALKTGTLSEPYSVFGTAGYLRKRDGGWIAFAVLVNGASARKSFSMRESLAAIRSDVDDLLERY